MDFFDTFASEKDVKARFFSLLQEKRFVSTILCNRKWKQPQMLVCRQKIPRN
jgi:hypothetical protein